MIPVGEMIVLSLRQGRLNRCEVFDKDGNKLCELPVIGYETRERLGEAPSASLLFHGGRVVVND